MLWYDIKSDFRYIQNGNNTMSNCQSRRFLSGYTERERYNMLHSFPMVFCDGVEHLTQLFSACSEYWLNWNPLASLFYFSKAEGSAMAEMKTWGPNFCTWPGHDPSQVSAFTSSFSWPWSKTHHPFSHTNQSLLLYCEHTQDRLVKWALSPSQRQNM